MKFFKKVLISGIILCLLVLFVAPKTVNAAVNSATRDVESWKYAGSWDSPSEYVPEGAKVTLKGAESAGSADAWRHKVEINRHPDVHPIFSLNNNGKITFEFSIGMYDDAGNIISQSQNDGGGALDITAFDYNNNELMRLRIWVNSGSGNNGDHSFMLFGPGWSTPVEGSDWIKGDASLNDSFFIQFDKENLFSSYVGGKSEITRLDNASNSFLAAQGNQTNLQNADIIHFTIDGSNGFTKDTEFILRSVNGVSLAESSGGGSGSTDGPVSSTVPFVTLGNSSTTATFVPEGVQITTPQANAVTRFGAFNLAYGLDVKFIVPKTGNSGTNPNDAYFDLNLTNVDNANYSLKYRIWMQAYDGVDRPTNIFITKNGSTTDLTDAGWISQYVDGIDYKFHMAFDITDTLLGERKDGALTQVDVGVNAIKDFINSCPSTNFYLGFELSGGAAGHYEYTVTEINGQSLANTDGTYETVNDAVLHIGNLPEAVTLNQSLDINVYSKDIFASTVNKVSITTPSNVTNDYNDVTKLNYKFSELGTYKIKVSTTGSNNVEVVKEFEIGCKTSVSQITFTKPTYPSTYSLGDKITILAGSNYSSSVVTKEIIVVMPNGEEKAVNVGDKVEINGPGIYTIRYIAKDNAQPTPNQKVEEVHISVFDVEKPVVTVNVPTTAKTGDKISFDVTVVDESAYDLNIYVTYPDKTVKEFKLDEEFIPSKTGAYTIEVVVEDLYWNKTVTTIQLTVSGEDIDTKTEDNNDNLFDEETEDDNGGLFDDDLFDDNFDDSDSDLNDQSNGDSGFPKIFIIIGIIIVLVIPGVIVYVVKSRKYR